MEKVVLITGGSSGIGKSIGEFLHAKGFMVYGTSRNPERITNSVFPLIALDVRNVASIQKAVSEIISKFKLTNLIIRK
jgi:NADP-dependent 3-hydroxy acid dehydrogenase YdfG